jgi:hypothetical protein
LLRPRAYGQQRLSPAAQAMQAKLRLRTSLRRGEDGALIEDPEQQKAIQAMRRMRAKGLTLRAIPISWPRRASRSATWG